MTPEKYNDLVVSIYNLIVSDIDSLKNNDMVMLYPRIVTMYEFFRLLRGEAFVDNRPPTPKNQKDFYKMEDEIAKKLDRIKSKIDFNDERVGFYIKEAQKAFNK